VSVTDLIDTTEMYLRTIFELEEEGTVPLRARATDTSSCPRRGVGSPLG